MKNVFFALISVCLIFAMSACQSSVIQAPLQGASKTECTYLFMVKQDGKYGFINEKGEVVISIKYDEAIKFNEGVAAVLSHVGENWEIININGNVIGKTEHKINSIFSEGLAEISNEDPKNPKCGYVNTQGEVVIPYSNYNMVGYFNEGFASVREINQMHAGNFINTKGEKISSVTYDLVMDFSEGMAEVKRDDKFGFIDANGDLVIPTTYDYVTMFSHGLASVKREGEKTGYINKKGEIIIDCIYNKTSPFSEGLAIVVRDGVYIAIDTEGNEVLVFSEYTSVDSFSEGLARVEKGGKIGFVNKNGELVVPIIYSPMGMPKFKCGVAVIEKDGKYGVIDNENNTVVPFEYDYICEFNEGYAVAENGGKSGVINTKGEITVDFIYDEVYSGYTGMD